MKIESPYSSLISALTRDVRAGQTLNRYREVLLQVGLWEVKLTPNHGTLLAYEPIC